MARAAYFAVEEELHLRMSSMKTVSDRTVAQSHHSHSSFQLLSCHMIAVKARGFMWHAVVRTRKTLHWFPLSRFFDVGSYELSLTMFFLF